MFNISFKLNKKINTHVFFADENFNIVSNISDFLKKNLKNINFYKEEFKSSNYLSIDTFSDDSKCQILIFKIKFNSQDYDYQKLGGLVYDNISKYQNINLFLGNSNFFKKNFNNFVENFF